MDYHVVSTVLIVLVLFCTLCCFFFGVFLVLYFQHFLFVTHGVGISILLGSRVGHIGMSSALVHFVNGGVESRGPVLHIHIHYIDSQ